MSAGTLAGFAHRFEPAAEGAAGPPLLLLHGTGGTEDDLVPLGRRLRPGAALVSPRGPVLEGGMPRFFSRLAEGRFDPDEVRRGALALGDFVEAARRDYGLPAPVALGFSNGANAASALMLLRPGALAGAVLLRPMMVLEEAPGADLAGTPVLVLSGAGDAVVPAGSADRLAEQLRGRGAAVEARTVPGGHGLTRVDLTAAADWFAARFP